MPENINDFQSQGGKVLDSSNNVKNWADGIDTDGTQKIEGKYQDLGQVVTGTNMGAGTVVWSNWIDNVNWVRYIRIMVQSDQVCQISISRRDSTLTGDSPIAAFTNIAATGSGAWAYYIMTPTASDTTNGIPGYSFRIGVKNTAASANTFANLRVQIIGQ